MKERQEFSSAPGGRQNGWRRISLKIKSLNAVTGSQTGAEGCLSLPGKAGTVTRPNYVKARAFDENMEEYEIEGTELMARAICHELDHLDGHMYTEIVEGPLHDVTYDDPEE